MATDKDLKRTASAILRSWSKSQASSSTAQRGTELAQQIERLGQIDRTANRDKSIRVSADGMYVRNNAGSYISKADAERSIDTLKRLAKKRLKDVESAD
jgi:hypothetical protein